MPRPVSKRCRMPVERELHRWPDGATITFAAVAIFAALICCACQRVAAQPPEPASGRAPAAAAPAPLSNDETQSLVKRVLQTELHAAEDTGHPMQYRLHKVSPRLATTKLIVETKDGDVARLLSINDGQLSPQDEQNEET